MTPGRCKARFHHEAHEGTKKGEVKGDFTTESTEDTKKG